MHNQPYCIEPAPGGPQQGLSALPQSDRKALDAANQALNDDIGTHRSMVIRIYGPLAPRADKTGIVTHKEAASA